MMHIVHEVYEVFCFKMKVYGLLMPHTRNYFLRSRGLPIQIKKWIFEILTYNLLWVTVIY